MLKKAAYLILAITFLTGATISSKPDGIHVGKISVSELQSLFSKNNFPDYFGKDNIYPRIFLKTLPNDFEKIEDLDKRNNLFFMITIPLALRVNESILAEREEILKIREEFKENDELTEKQTKFIEEKAVKYDIFTRVKGYRRLDYLLNELVLKVDAIPPSVLVASAAIDTEFGSSNAALKANNLFKQLVWYGEEKGLKPETKTDEQYEIKIFQSLYDSMLAQALKINSGVDFYSTRHLREELRFREKSFLGTDFAHSLLLVANLKNYIGLLDYTITFYGLNTVDLSKLKKMS